MKRMCLTLVLILIIPIIFASCEEGQIDINSASKEELIKINYIGEVRAEEIIKMRPFDSVDELIEVYGIGEATLQKIKTQGLACVENEKDDEDVEENNFFENVENNKEIKNKEEERKIETIVLTPAGKDIKTEENSEEKDSSKYIFYLLTGFCVLLGFLFLLKKRKYKNEFK